VVLRHLSIAKKQVEKNKVKGRRIFEISKFQARVKCVTRNIVT